MAEMWKTKIHIKFESLVKDTSYNIEEHRERVIAWMNYPISAMFCPVMVNVKKRLKMIMK